MPLAFSLVFKAPLIEQVFQQLPIRHPLSILNSHEVPTTSLHSNHLPTTMPFERPPYQPLYSKSKAAWTDKQKQATLLLQQLDHGFKEHQSEHLKFPACLIGWTVRCSF